jgi:short-subunit dehydrogenase
MRSAHAHVCGGGECGVKKSLAMWVSVLYFAACKMGLYGYFTSLASEIADSGVSVTVCCPGPVAAAEGAAPRAVYGATGMITQQHQQQGGKPDKARMSPQVRL